jgi:hypothetical protein
VFNIFNCVSIWLTVLLLSGCWAMPLPSGDTPDEFTGSKKTIRSLLGSTSEEVIDTVGQPAFIVLKDNKPYYIYEWWSDELDIMMIGVLPTPIVMKDEETEAHCILLEFGNDRRLRSYKVDTESGDLLGFDTTYNCLQVFGMRGSGSRLLYKYPGLSPEDMKKETAWRLDREVKTYCPNADAGDVNAQKYVGDFYSFGFFSLKKDLIRAYVWYSLAAKSANKEASEQLGYLVKELSPQQLKEARTQLDEWEPGQCERDLMEAILD